MTCPVCGYRDPADTYRLVPDNKIQFFCDGCGAFVTILLGDEHAEVVHRPAGNPPGV